MQTILRVVPKQIKEPLKKVLRTRLLRRLPEHSVGLEIGVDKGDFTAQILKVVKPTKLHLIDPWSYFSEESYAEARYGGKAGNQHAMDQRYTAVAQRFANAIEQGVVELHRDYSQNMVAQFEDRYFDWVYVDGDHLYEAVLEDLRAYHRKVKPGGYLLGDDYRTPGWWNDGVTRAVDEFAAQNDVTLHIIGRFQFMIRVH